MDASALEGGIAMPETVLGLKTREVRAAGVAMVEPRAAWA